jgi:hypothetical protein
MPNTKTRRFRVANTIVYTGAEYYTRELFNNIDILKSNYEIQFDGSVICYTKIRLTFDPLPQSNKNNIELFIAI